MNLIIFACPVCHQHLKCDSSQCGSIMKCPTCYQRVIAPQVSCQADSKLVLTGQKYVEKNLPAHGSVQGNPQVTTKNSVSGGLIAVWICGLAALGGALCVYFFMFAPGLHSKDVGDVGKPGFFKLAQGVFNISGSGAGIVNQADSFHGVFQALDGDAVLTVRVLSMKNTHEWAKAGIMIRETAQAGSTYASICVRPNGQVQSTWRNTTGAGTGTSDLAGGNSFPKWLKIVRAGNSFSMFFKAKAEEGWKPLCQQMINMSGEANIGMVVCSHKAGTLCDVFIDEVTLTTGSGTDNSVKTVPVTIAPQPSKPVAPKANDKNWTYDLTDRTIPNSPVVGRIHGKDFQCARAVFQAGRLILSSEAGGPMEFGAIIDFKKAIPEALAGKTINITTNVAQAAQVTLRWKNNGKVVNDSNVGGYALRLEFGSYSSNRLPGKMYLCTSDNTKSYLMGIFNADTSLATDPKSASKY